MAQERLRNRFALLLWMIAIMWIVFYLDRLLGLGALRLGILPRDVDGLKGVLFWPVLHGNVAHLTSNSISLLVFGGIVSAQRGRRLLGLSIFVTIVGGLGVWLIGRPSLHIGASGLVFGFFGYIVMRGFYDRSLTAVLIAAGVILLFGGMIWGVLPNDPRVSWEGHFCGLAAGMVWGRSRK